MGSPETLRKFSSVDNDWMLLGTIHGETRLFKVAYITEINQGVIEVRKKCIVLAKLGPIEKQKLMTRKSKTKECVELIDD